jgi:hypothetical protein
MLWNRTYVIGHAEMSRHAGAANLHSRARNMRYYFHLRIGDAISPDELGLELPNGPAPRAYDQPLGDDRSFGDDPTRRQTAADEWVEKLCDLIRRWQPQCWGVESGQIKSAIGPYLRKRMIERSAYCRLKELVTTLFRVANCCCRGSPSEMKPDSTCSLRTFQIPRFAKCDGFTVPVKIALGGVGVIVGRVL